MPLSRNPSVRGTRSAVHRSRRSPLQHRPRRRLRRWYRWHHHHHHHPRPPPAPPRRLCPARTPCRPWRPLPLATTLRHPLSLSVPLPTSCWRVGEALAPDDTAVRRLRRGSCDSCPRTRPAERHYAMSSVKVALTRGVVRDINLPPWNREWNGLYKGHCRKIHVR